MMKPLSDTVFGDFRLTRVAADGGAGSGNHYNMIRQLASSTACGTDLASQEEGPWYPPCPV